MPSLFITGTDTDVGKTVVTMALASASACRAVKPLASGAEPGGTGDAERIAMMAGHTPLIHTQWARPVSPHRAALEEGRPLDVPALLAWLDAIDGDRLVEGAGGWRVPFSRTPSFTVSDLARHCALPVVVVSANRLGVLNHTMLTVEAIERDGLNIAGVVLNDVEPSSDDASRSYNLDDLNDLLEVPVIAMPHLNSLNRSDLTPHGVRLWNAFGH